MIEQPKKRVSFLPLFVAFIVVISVGLAMTLLLRTQPQASSGEHDLVGVMSLEGIITDSIPFLTGLKKLAENDDVAAVVVRVDSPGGAVAPSQEIYHALLELRAKKPVVVSMGTVAASGGFYVASAGTKVLANPGTLTGSIGVIMQMTDLTQLLDSVGVEFNVIKTGKLKDAGAFYQKMDATERVYFQELIDEVLNQFIEDVATARQAVTDVTVDSVRAVADGRVFTGQKAKELGFVDALGGFDEAIDIAAQLGGIVGKPEIYRPKLGPNWIERFLEEGFEGTTKALVKHYMPVWTLWVP